MKRWLFVLVFLVCTGSLVFAAASRQSGSDAQRPLQISMYYSDNSTLPFRSDWLTVRKLEELYNVRINWEIIPMGDYATKVSLALNSGNTPDVILYQNSSGENGSLALNGAIVPISDYAAWTPEWNARVQEFGMQTDVDRLKLKDGKRYFMPSLTDKPFYDGGLLLREDVIAKYGMGAPKTYDDLYQLLKAYKADNPNSYPFTIYYGPRVHYRMTQPAWGISVGRNGPSGRVLSYDYGRDLFFAGATSEQYREYLRFWHKLYAEGLLDHEIAEPIQDSVWYRKLATGSAIGTLGWYDQIGGIHAASEIPGLKFNMYPPLEGPAGARAEPKNRTGNGILFPIAASKRADFERVVRTVDAMFFSKEAALLWCLGVEGETYTMQGNTVRFANSIANSPDGIYKSMQINYGCGSATTQMIWVNAREMTKYDENYADINARVAAMDQAIQPVPPVPLFDDLTAERVTSLMGVLFDALVVWDDAFITGTRSIDTDWAAYVAEMRQKGIDEYLNLYNSNLR
jgi:putative aldouronate transport system substrate-binding protein